MSTHLLYVDAVACAAEDETGAHGLGEASSLAGLADGFLTNPWKARTWLDISSCSPNGKLTK